MYMSYLGLQKAIKINRTLYKLLRFSRKYVILNQVSNALTVFLPVAVAITRMISETRGINMTVSYKKLWKLLIDKDMKKKDLEKAAGISNYVISKMNKGENITVDIVGKICSALNCTPNDIMEFSDDSI